MNSDLIRVVMGYREDDHKNAPREKHAWWLQLACGHEEVRPWYPSQGEWDWQPFARCSHGCVRPL